jgi:hypothetical protein
MVREVVGIDDTHLVCFPIFVTCSLNSCISLRQVDSEEVRRAGLRIPINEQYTWFGWKRETSDAGRRFAYPGTRKKRSSHSEHCHLVLVV